MKLFFKQVEFRTKISARWLLLHFPVYNYHILFLDFTCFSAPTLRKRIELNFLKTTEKKLAGPIGVEGWGLKKICKIPSL